MPDLKASRENRSTVVLLSSGLDSTFNLYKAHESHDVLLALTFDYGQRAARREVAAAARLAADLGIRHQTVTLPWFKEFTSTSLVSGTEIPQGSLIEIDNLDRSLETARSVWVPNRNGIFLNIAAGFAEGVGASFVVPGFNIEEAQTFPDNTQEFLDTLDKSWAYSTATRVRSLCFSTKMNKSEIVRESIALGVPFASLWPCYLDGVKWCGECESCKRFSRALHSEGLSFAQVRDEAHL